MVLDLLMIVLDLGNQVVLPTDFRTRKVKTIPSSYELVGKHPPIQTEEATANSVTDEQQLS